VMAVNVRLLNSSGKVIDAHTYSMPMKQISHGAASMH